MIGRYYFVYIATNKLNSVLYTGVTNDLVKRGFQHKTGVGSKFTSKYKITKIIYYEALLDINEAIKREKQIKNLVRRKKIDLINHMNPEWKDLLDKLD